MPHQQRMLTCWLKFPGRVIIRVAEWTTDERTSPRGFHPQPASHSRSGAQQHQQQLRQQLQQQPAAAGSLNYHQEKTKTYLYQFSYLYLYGAKNSLYYLLSLSRFYIFQIFDSTSQHQQQQQWRYSASFLLVFYRLRLSSSVKNTFNRMGIRLRGVLADHLPLDKQWLPCVSIFLSFFLCSEHTKWTLLLHCLSSFRTKIIIITLSHHISSCY